MAAKIVGPEIERVIQLLARLPGLGPRSARKAALALIKRREDLLVPLAGALSEAATRLRICPVCGNVDTMEPCSICQDQRRDPRLIVVVEGRYHVLGGHLSPLDGVGPERLNIPKLIERAAPGSGVEEVLLALNATVEGQSTAHYLTEQLARSGVTVSRLAQGVPIGGELDYLDEGTLAAAVRSRLKV